MSSRHNYFTRPTKCVVNEKKKTLADLAVVFLGGVLAKGPSQGTPKAKNSTDFGHYCLEGTKFALEKNVRLATVQSKIIKNATEVDIFM